MTNTITLSPDPHTHTVSPLLYGQFVEHMGRGVYDGLWVGSDSDIPHDGGLRRDTVDALRALHLPVLRWPGGLWADTYHWRDGIGRPANRPVRQNLGWNTTETNAFGLHEFMHLCDLIGTQPYLCVNMGSGTVREASEWAEYCNSALDTTVTRERAANGHPEPFGVRLWGLGNEPYYDLDGLMTESYYVNVARNYAGYLKHIASQRTLSTDDGFNNVRLVWALEGAAVKSLVDSRVPPGFVDLLAIHFYTGKFYTPAVPLPGEMPDAERDYYNSIADLARFQAVIDETEGHARALRVQGHAARLAVDEWGTWWPESVPTQGMMQRAPLGDAVWAAAGFHLMQQYPTIDMANMAQTVNVAQCLVKTEGARLCVTPTYHVWEMFGPHKGARFVPVALVCGEHVALPENGTRPALSVSATQDGYELFLSVINFDLRQSVTTTIVVAGSKGWQAGDGRTLTGDSVDAHNIFDDPERVRPRRLDVGSGAVTFAPLSVSTLRLRRTLQQ